MIFSLIYNCVAPSTSLNALGALSVTRVSKRHKPSSLFELNPEI